MYIVGVFFFSHLVFFNLGVFVGQAITDRDLDGRCCECVEEGLCYVGCGRSGEYNLCMVCLLQEKQFLQLVSC